MDRGDGAVRGIGVEVVDAGQRLDVFMQGELKRTTFQLRIFADEVERGAFVDARIDRPDAEWPMGAPRPDLRRMLVPLGPVASTVAPGRTAPPESRTTPSMEPVVSCAIAAGTLASASANAKNVLNNTLRMNQTSKLRSRRA